MNYSDEDYKFKVTLVFWKFYELGEYFELLDLRRFLEKESNLKLYETYHCHITHPFTGEECHQPLKWVSSQSHNYKPICFKIGKSDRFTCAKNSSICGKLRLEGHIHYGSVLVIHCELLFDNYHMIEDFSTLDPLVWNLYQNGSVITSEDDALKINTTTTNWNNGVVSVDTYPIGRAEDVGTYINFRAKRSSTVSNAGFGLKPFRRVHPFDLLSAVIFLLPLRYLFL